MKKSLRITFSLTLLVLTNSFGQSKFQNHIYTDGIETLNSVTQTSDSNFVLAGGTRNTSSSYGIFIAKINPNGDTLWTHSYSHDIGSQTSSVANSIVETSDHGFYVTGYTQAFSLNFQFYILRLDSLGDTLWTRTVQHPLGAENYGYSGIQTKDGNFVSFGRQGYFQADFFLNKFDAAGSLLWSKSYDIQNQNDFGNSVNETYDHGLIMGGSQNEIINQKILILKADSVGNYLWGKCFYGGIADECNMIKQTADSGFLIVGNTESFGAGSSDILVIKTNSQGDTLWTKAYGTTGYEQCFAFSQTPDQGYILTGQAPNPLTTSPGYLLMKIDMNGNLEWSKVYRGGISLGNSKSVALTTDYGYLICGEGSFFIKVDEFGNSGCDENNVIMTAVPAPVSMVLLMPTLSVSVSVGSNPLNSHRGADIINFCFDNGTESLKEESDWLVYPNPANEKMVIQLKENNSTAQLLIYDMLGNKRFEMKLNNNSRCELNIENWPLGVYSVLLKSEKGIFSKRIIHQ